MSVSIPKANRTILGLSEVEREIGFINCCISFGFAMSANILLAYTVTKRSTTLLKSYRKVFIVHITIDVALSLMFFLTMCQPIGTKSPDNGRLILFYIVDGIISHPPQPWTSILASILSFLININITTAAVSFIYRYFLICHDYELSWLLFTALIILAGTLPFVYATLMLENEMESRYLEAPLSALFNNTDWIESDGTLPVFGVMITEAISFSQLITPLTILLTYGIVIYAAIRMTLKVRSIKHFKKPGQNQQHQLQIVILFQAIIPFFTSGLSILAIQIGRISNLPQPWWYFYANILNSWSPVVNPAVALFVIAPYRKFIFRSFYRVTKLTPTKNDLPYIGNTVKDRIKMTAIMSN